MERIFKFSVFYLLAWLIVPPIRVGSEWRILFCLCFAIFLFQTFQIQIRRITHLCVPFLGFIGFIGMTFVRGEFSDVNFWVNFIRVFVFFSFATVYVYYQDQGFERFRPLFLPIIFILSIFNITTIGALLRDPEICRIMATGTDLSMSSRYSTIDLLLSGGFPYVYNAVFITPLLCSVALLRKTVGLEKVVLIVCVVSSVVMVSLAGFSIGVLLLFLGFLLLLVNRYLSWFSLCVFFTLLWGVFVVCRGFLYEMALAFAGENEFYIAKIEAIFNPTTAGNELDGRVAIWMTSLKSFFSNPIIGGGSAGGHSAILDYLGMYGIFVGGAMVWTMFFPIVVEYKRMKQIGRHGLVVLFSVILLGGLLLNPLQFQYAAVIFILFPYVCEHYYLNARLKPVVMQKKQNIR